MMGLESFIVLMAFYFYDTGRHLCVREEVVEEILIRELKSRCVFRGVEVLEHSVPEGRERVGVERRRC